MVRLSGLVPQYLPSCGTLGHRGVGGIGWRARFFAARRSTTSVGSGAPLDGRPPRRRSTPTMGRLRALPAGGRPRGRTWPGSGGSSMCFGRTWAPETWISAKRVSSGEKRCDEADFSGVAQPAKPELGVAKIRAGSTHPRQNRDLARPRPAKAPHDSSSGLRDCSLDEALLSRPTRHTQTSPPAAPPVAACRSPACAPARAQCPEPMGSRLGRLPLVGMGNAW